MGSPSYGSIYPSTAYWLSMIGGVLVLLSGISAILEGIFLTSFLESILPGISAVVIGEGIAGVLFGVVIIYAASRLRNTPASARTWGIAIIVFAVLSIFGGGGFLLGFILALIGGILAATWHPPVMPQSGYGQPGYGAPMNPSAAASPWAPPAAPPLRPGSAQRYCSSCGSPNLAAAQFCAKCGAPMS